jgi:hypothetical protein
VAAVCESQLTALLIIKARPFKVKRTESMDSHDLEGEQLHELMAALAGRRTVPAFHVPSYYSCSS